MKTDKAIKIPPPFSLPLTFLLLSLLPLSPLSPHLTSFSFSPFFLSFFLSFFLTPLQNFYDTTLLILPYFTIS